MVSYRMPQQNPTQWSSIHDDQELAYEMPATFPSLQHGAFQSPQQAPPPYSQTTNPFQTASQTKPSYHLKYPENFSEANPFRDNSHPVYAQPPTHSESPSYAQSPSYSQQQHQSQRQPRTSNWGLLTYNMPEQPSYNHAPSQGPATSRHPTPPPIDDAMLSQALVFTSLSLPPPSSSRPHRLSRPIAIPQMTSGRGLPFLRAWAPEIQLNHVTQADFLAFIDNLNVVSTANPPLQVLNLAGSMIGMVPYHWASIAGFAIQTTAQLGTAAVSRGRTEVYMKEVNERLFHPRGLQVRIASSDAMRAVLRIPREEPIVVPLDSETMRMSGTDRVLEAVRPFSADLDFNVPEPVQQSSVLAKLSARQVERQGKQNDKKALKEREKAMEKHMKRERKEAMRVEKEIGKNGFESVSEFKKEEGGKEQEAKRAGKLLWILIENLEEHVEQGSVLAQPRW